MPFPFMGVHLCWCLAQPAASPAQLCNSRERSTRLASHPSLPCLQGPASGENGIISALLQSPLGSLGNSWVQWPQTRCSSTLNQMFFCHHQRGVLDSGTTLSWCFRCCPSWSISSKPSVIDDSPAMKWFSFPSSRNGTVWVLICKSVGNLNEGEGDRFNLDYVVGIPLEEASL